MFHCRFANATRGSLCKSNRYALRPNMIVQFICLGRNLKLKVKYFSAKLSSSRRLSTPQLQGGGGGEGRDTFWSSCYFLSYLQLLGWWSVGSVFANVSLWIHECNTSFVVINLTGGSWRTWKMNRITPMYLTRSWFQPSRPRWVLGNQSAYLTYNRIELGMNRVTTSKIGTICLAIRGWKTASQSDPHAALTGNRK